MRSSERQVPPAVAESTLAFLDARSLVAFVRTGRLIDSVTHASALVLSLANLKALSHARARVETALQLPRTSCDDGDASAPVLSAASRGGAVGWLAALDDIESWAHMREAACHDPSSQGGIDDALLPPNDILSRGLARLRLKEDLCLHTFPQRSLFYSALHSSGGRDEEAGAKLFSWRSRLAQWLRNLAAHFKLPPAAVTNAVALADRYLLARGASMHRTGVQLLFITSFCICARSHGAPESDIAALRAIAHDYADSEFGRMESLMAAEMARGASVSLAPPLLSPGGQRPGAAAAATATTAADGSPPAGDEVASRSHQPPLLPRGPPGILSRFDPSPALPQLPAEVDLVLLTAPTALAGSLLCLLPPAWVRQVRPVVDAVLLVAMLEIDAHSYSPPCLATAAVFLGLRACGLDAHPSGSATFWAVLAQRALHIDLTTVRRCAVQLEAWARRLVAGPAAETLEAVLPLSLPRVKFAEGGVASDAAVLRAAAVLQGHAYPAAPLAPVSACGPVGCTLARLHPWSFAAAVLAEAALAGAAPDAVESLHEAAYRAIPRLRARWGGVPAAEEQRSPPLHPAPPSTSALVSDPAAALLSAAATTTAFSIRIPSVADRPLASPAASSEAAVAGTPAVVERLALAPAPSALAIARETADTAAATVSAAPDAAAAVAAAEGVADVDAFAAALQSVEAAAAAVSIADAEKPAAAGLVDADAAAHQGSEHARAPSPLASSARRAQDIARFAALQGPRSPFPGLGPPLMFSPERSTPNAIVGGRRAFFFGTRDSNTTPSSSTAGATTPSGGVGGGGAAYADPGSPAMMGTPTATFIPSPHGMLTPSMRSPSMRTPSMRSPAGSLRFIGTNSRADTSEPSYPASPLGDAMGAPPARVRVAPLGIPAARRAPIRAIVPVLTPTGAATAAAAAVPIGASATTPTGAAAVPQTGGAPLPRSLSRVQSELSVRTFHSSADESK